MVRKEGSGKRPPFFFLSFKPQISLPKGLVWGAPFFKPTNWGPQGVEPYHKERRVGGFILEGTLKTSHSIPSHFRGRYSSFFLKISPSLFKRAPPPFLEALSYKGLGNTLTSWSAPLDFLKRTGFFNMGAPTAPFYKNRGFFNMSHNTGVSHNIPPFLGGPFFFSPRGVANH